VTATLAFVLVAAAGRGADLDESPAREGEWGYRPAAGSTQVVTPPAFSWRPTKGLVSWEIECSRGADFATVEYRAADIDLNVHCPPRVFPTGTHHWRYRGVDAKGKATRWSRVREFAIDSKAVPLPMPARAELLDRIPTAHPRLFVRPEGLPRLRELARGPLASRYRELVRQCDALVASPPPTAEPPKYPPGTKRLGESWRKIWWGNRTYTIRALNGAATLAFTRLLGDPDEYGHLAKRILLECAEWDPVGSTGYRYNDEAGMPYAYYFSRTYSFVHDLLNESEREICRRVMKIRGEEMYRHLCPRHLWRPYSSHSNRAWHFLGEVGIAFLGEIDGADDWLWFATNVFFNAYPVWSDDDGGWHEGASYWSSYVGRFTWWADVMRTATEIDAYDKPYFADIGYYAMYLMPPGKVGGGFGDLTAKRTSRSNADLMTTVAAQASNGHWQWYVEQVGGARPAGGYIGFVRGALPAVDARAPDDLPASRLFRGTGQACLNSDLTKASRDVQIVFKSSPFGTQSHGYEANNSFLLWAYGQRLLIRSGRRDIHGSSHHRQWMHSTRSVNNITVGGAGQIRNSARSRGEITSFATTSSIDIVSGEAGNVYRDGDRKVLDRFTRTIVFVKPELVIVYDRLAAREPASFEYWLHAVNEFAVDGQHDVTLSVKDVRCDIDFLTPAGLTFEQTDQYDPNPRPRVSLREWHLTATTAQPARAVEFVTLYRPHRADVAVPSMAKLERLDGGYALRAELSDGHVVALMPTVDGAMLAKHGLESRGKIVVERRRADGSVVQGLRETDL